MIDRRELEQRNDALHAEHLAAIARGEERVLRLTRTGELHSYAPDEIGLGEVTAGTQITSWWGLSLLATTFGALFVLSWVIVLTPAIRDGGPPTWGGLALTALSAGLGGWTLVLARRQYAARATRRRRGAPEPSDSPVPDRWRTARMPRPPRPPHPRAHRWRRRPWWWVTLRGLLAGAFILAVVGTIGDPDPRTTDARWVAGVGLVLTLGVPLALAARRVRTSRV
ncbi:hypothetical protein [Nocardioides albidus]|uniref:hypothetical protein n=1 Tax=Nocardioides albidus TaxID=1517589 RepID=UPI0018653AA4|nr:hypothetical protein [Nocardioides albidus]